MLSAYGMIGISRSSKSLDRLCHIMYKDVPDAIYSFPTHGFPSEIYVYHPPLVVKDAHIAKITSCDDTFAALSSNGEVFTFSVPNPSDLDASGRDRAVIKPQRVWALRKQFSGVRVSSSDSLPLLLDLLANANT